MTHQVNDFSPSVHFSCPSVVFNISYSTWILAPYYMPEKVKLKLKSLSDLREYTFFS